MNTIRKINKIFLLLLLFFVGNEVYSKGISQNIEYIKSDSIDGDANGDNLIDYILVSLEDGGNNIKLDFFLKNKKNGYRKKTLEWFAVGRYRKIQIEHGYLIFSLNYSMREVDISTLIYKYFPGLDCWFTYGFINTKALEFNKFSGWKNPTLKNVDLSSTHALGMQEIDEGYSIIDRDSIRMIDEFLKDYDDYFVEYKSKLYDRILMHDKYKTLDYLNYVDINKSTVQKYNDIGFFLLEAKQYEQAIYILENVLYKYPNRIVAYINLGDAYWGLDNKSDAKEAYKKYIELMKANGKQSKIPQRIYNRVK